MEDEVDRGDSGHQTSEATSGTDLSASAIANESCTDSATNLATTPATVEYMDAAASTTFGAMDINSSCDSQEPVKEPTSNNHVKPGTTQEFVTVGFAEALSAGKVDCRLLPDSTNSGTLEETVVLKENVAITRNETLAGRKTEQENPSLVSTEDMEVAVTTPVTNEHFQMVTQPAVASATKLEFLRKCEGLSSITQYRGDSSDNLSSDSDSDSDSSSSSSCSSSSSSSSLSSPGPLNIVVEEDGQEEGVGKGKASEPLKTQDEVLVDELPAVEDLHISLPEDTELKPMGLISSIVDTLVIVESFKDAPPLNDDSIIFNEKRVAIGKVFEVFGPVLQPFYVLRFNSDKHIAEKELKPKDTVYFAPAMKDFTDYIFTERLRQLKGSDASWKNDQEPPPEALDYSDDEQEALAKRKLKEQRQGNVETAEGDKEKQKPSGKRPPRREPPRQAWGPRPRAPPSPRAGPPGPRLSYQHHLPNPHFRPPPPLDGGYALHAPCPRPPPFQAPPPYFPMYPLPPPAHMPWAPLPFPGMFMPPPPPPPPPPHSAGQMNQRPN